MQRGDGVNEHDLSPSQSLRPSLLADTEAAGAGWEAALKPPLLSALRLLAGTPRAVIYDLPPELAPHPAPGSPVFVLGCRRWQRFLHERRRYDDGEPTLIIALRPLAPWERRLVVDWGTAHANTFLLVEPRDPTCDLTGPTGASRSCVEPEVARPLSPAEVDRNQAQSRLLQRLRQAYGLWTRWEGETPHMESLDLTAGGDTTLWDALARPPREGERPLRFINLRHELLATGMAAGYLFQNPK